MPPAIVAVDYPIIRTLPLGTFAHYSEDMAPWRAAPTRRGAGFRVLPMEDGVVPRPVFKGKLRILHEVIVSGRQNPDGVPYTDWTEGLDANLALLYAACEPNPVWPYTFQITHVRPQGSRVAQGMVVDIVVPDHFGPGIVTVGLDIVIPSGTFT
jgi:hypothetical protein